MLELHGVAPSTATVERLLLVRSTPSQATCELAPSLPLGLHDGDFVFWGDFLLLAASWFIAALQPLLNSSCYKYKGSSSICPFARWSRAPNPSPSFSSYILKVTLFLLLAATSSYLYCSRFPSWVVCSFFLVLGHSASWSFCFAGPTWSVSSKVHLQGWPENNCKFMAHCFQSFLCNQCPIAVALWGNLCAVIWYLLF